MNVFATFILWVFVLLPLVIFRIENEVCGLFCQMEHANSNEPWIVCLGTHCHWNVLICTQHSQLYLQQYSFYILGQAATAAGCCVTVFILGRNTETYFDTRVISDNFKLGAATARTVKVLTRWMLTLVNCWQNMLTLTMLMLNLYLHLHMHVVLWNEEVLETPSGESLYFEFAWFNILTLTFDL